MLNEQTIAKLYAMKLSGMAEGMKAQMARADMDGLAFEERFAMLVDAQHLYQENKRLKRLLESAKLKISASLEDIDYRTPRGLDKSVMLSLGSCEWIRRHRNQNYFGQECPIIKKWACVSFLRMPEEIAMSDFFASSEKGLNRAEKQH